jgi:hypothetical protein|tara:strand:+ start:1246 stop:2373 length:1128 start_codon:yes stop_codon:yes gene_type:complete
MDMERIMPLQEYVQQLRPRTESYTPHVDKIQSLLSEGLKAEDYEAAIVIGWHKIHDMKLNPSSAGISSKVMSVLEKEPLALESGERIAAQVAKHFRNGGAKAEQYGRAKAKLTPFWKSFGAGDITPKTDILIGDKRLSLKIGVAQLMSGGKSESMATFYAALQSTPELKESQQFQKVNEVFESFVTSTLAPSQLRPLIKSGENPIVNSAEIAHKDCMRELGALFEQNREFKIAFAREAMSGFQKFGSSSPAAAEFMLVASHDGTSVSIHSVNDDAYCEKIADSMKLQARFKTSSRKLKGVKTGEYNFWSVVSLIVDAMGSDSLQESVFSVAKGKLKRIGLKILKGVKSFMMRGVTNLMKFLGAEPQIKVQTRVKF